MAARLISLFVFLIVLLGIIASPGPAFAQAPAQDSSYRIGPNDVLNIFVWKETELTRDVTVFGKGKSELDELLARLAADQGRVLVEEPDVRAGWFYRSDQISFARAGVPAIWFKSGTDFIGRPAGWGEATYAEWIERKYHRPSDEVDSSWDLDGLEQDARLAFLLAATVAIRDAMPAWVPGDEFEDERLAALAELRQERVGIGPSAHAGRRLWGVREASR